MCFGGASPANPPRHTVGPAGDGPLLLGHVVHYPGLLSPAQRIGLAGALAVEGQPLAVFDAELAGMALPADPVSRIAVLRWLVGPPMLPVPPTLMDQPLAAVFPLLGRARGRIDPTALPQRLITQLQIHQVTTWRSLGRWRLSELASWPRVGGGALAALLRTALNASVQIAADQSEPPLPVPSRRSRRVAPPAAPALVAASAVLGGLGSTRDRIVFERLCLSTTLRPEDLVAALGVGVERVRQLRQRAEGKARDLATQQPALDEAVAAVRDRLGLVAPTAAVNATLSKAGLASREDVRTALVLWLAGPYRPLADAPGWIGSVREHVVALTAGLLDQDGGVHHREHLQRELISCGVLPVHAADWLSAQPIRVEGDEVVNLVGSPAAVAERLLHAAGTALTAEACRARAGDHAGPLAAWQAALARDRRFVHVGGDRFELAEWGGEAVHLPPPDRHRGRGAQRLVPPARTPETTEPRAAPDHPAPLTLRVVVDRELLAGRAGPVPLSFMVRLGIGVGAQRSMSSRYGPLLLINATDGARHGSLRPIALACGAAPGDVLQLVFDDGRTSVSVERQRGADQRTPTVEQTSWR